MLGRRASNRGGHPDDNGLSAETAETAGADQSSYGEQEPGLVRRWLTGLNRAVSPEPASPDDDLNLKPTAMRRPEPLYGYIVAVELVLVSILNLTVTHGKGAPAHPATLESLIGLAASLALFPIIRTNHRLIVAFATVIAAFFATLPRTPASLTLVHLLALIIPIMYAFILSSRQRKAASARAKALRSGSSGATKSRPSREPASDSGGRRRGRREKDAPTGPQASRRYTPPKAKRAR